MLSHWNLKMKHTFESKIWCSNCKFYKNYKLNVSSARDFMMQISPAAAKQYQFKTMWLLTFHQQNNKIVEYEPDWGHQCQAHLLSFETLTVVDRLTEFERFG